MDETMAPAGAENVRGEIGIPGSFASALALYNKLITRDLNNLRSTPTFYRYTKDEIARYITNPYQFEKQLRQAMIYLYGASSHFRRLIQYFVGLSDLSYVVSPQVDPKTANVNSVNRNYRKVLNMMGAFHVKSQFPKILTVCLREDVFYGTLWVTSDDIVIQQLPSDYCRISSVEENVPNVTFDFSYFDIYKDFLEYYPPEFTKKYAEYRKDAARKWIELDSPTSFAVKCSSDILDYALPPFAGLLRDLYDLEDYRDLKKTKKALENYALLAMKLAMDDEGRWLLDYDKAKAFWENLDSVLPEEVGSVLTPMDIEKIDFQKSNTGDTDSIAEATENLFTSAGVSSLLFNNAKASANALLLSIKVDQAVTYGIVKSIEDVVNRFMRHQSYGKYWKVTFLDVSRFNREEQSNQYLKACTYGLPMISYYCAANGLGQAEIDSMSYLETTVLGLQDMFRPIRNSAQLGAEDVEEGTGGRPRLRNEELTDSGEQSREDGDDW